MLTTYSLGSLDYPSAEKLQQRLAAAVAEGEHPPTLLLLEHPHVYTFGRQGKAENLLWDADELARRGISSHWTDRGGDVTYHGPGQLVGYPVLKLDDLDTLGYLRKLEEVLIRTLAGFGISAGRVDGQTGVWVPGEAGKTPPSKIASIGVRVDAHRVTRHGFALNVDPQMDYWKGIIACGLENQSKTSMAELLAPPPSVDEVAAVVIKEFEAVFETDAEEGDAGVIAGWMA
ncbi:MAG: lipoyl(octanoyl) transferase LipB [Anaerolineales bacterium]|jgi:lipoate-protein ligase B